MHKIQIQPGIGIFCMSKINKIQIYLGFWIICQNPRQIWILFIFDMQRSLGFYLFLTCKNFEKKKKFRSFCMSKINKIQIQPGIWTKCSIGWNSQRGPCSRAYVPFLDIVCLGSHG